MANELNEMLNKIKNNKDIFSNYIKLEQAFSAKGSKEEQIRKTAVENFRNWTSCAKPIVPQREKLIRIYYIYSLYSDEKNISAICNNMLSCVNYSPLSERVLEDLLMKIGMDYKIDIEIICRLFEKYVPIKNKVKGKIDLNSYTSGQYFFDFLKTTTLKLSMETKKLNAENIEKALSELIEKYQNSFSFYSNIRRCSIMNLFHKIQVSQSVKSHQRLIDYVIADVFLDSFGKTVLNFPEGVKSYDKLVSKLNRGKSNISRQGLVIFSIAAGIQSVKEISNILELCDFAILDKENTKFDYFICSLLNDCLPQYPSFKACYEECLKAFYASPQFEKAEDKRRFYVNNFPIKFDCLTTGGYR